MVDRREDQNHCIGIDVVDSLLRRDSDFRAASSVANSNQIPRKKGNVYSVAESPSSPSRPTHHGCSDTPSYETEGSGISSYPRIRVTSAQPCNRFLSLSSGISDGNENLSRAKRSFSTSHIRWNSGLRVLSSRSANLRHQPFKGWHSNSCLAIIHSQ